jgi:hypothetical protein
MSKNFEKLGKYFVDSDLWFISFALTAMLALPISFAILGYVSLFFTILIFIIFLVVSFPLLYTLIYSLYVYYCNCT